MTAAVEITDAVPQARRIPVEEITIQHQVFDVYGGTHALRRVHVGRTGVTIVRGDGVPSWHELGSTITVLEDPR